MTLRTIFLPYRLSIINKKKKGKKKEKEGNIPTVSLSSMKFI